MNMEVVLSAAVGILGAVAGSTALAAALTIRTWRETFSAGSLLLLAVALVSAWCVIEALYLQANVMQLLMMLIAAAHAMRMMHATSVAKRSTTWKTRQKIRT